MGLGPRAHVGTRSKGQVGPAGSRGRGMVGKAPWVAGRGWARIWDLGAPSSETRVGWVEHHQLVVVLLEVTSNMALLGHHLPGGDLSWVSSEGRQPQKLVWGLIILEVTWGTRLGGVLLKVTPNMVSFGCHRTGGDLRDQVI